MDNEKNNGQNGQQKNRVVPLLSVLCVLLLLILFVLVLGVIRKPQQDPASSSVGAVDPNAQTWQGEQQTYTGPKNTDTIDIPGFDVMNLQAGVTKQAVNLHNPPQNTCYFRITLLLADGTQLYQSGLLEPGTGLYEIELAQTLSAGQYPDATLKYECFTMDEAQSPLNGSEIKLTLNVMN